MAYMTSRPPCPEAEGAYREALAAEKSAAEAYQEAQARLRDAHQQWWDALDIRQHPGNNPAPPQ